MIERLNKKRGEEGFTLIELLIVIVILGILAAIVVFAVGGTGTNSAVAACKSDAKSLETALEAYKAQNGSYPQTPGKSDAGDGGWAALLNVGQNTPYLRSLPSTVHYVLWWDQTTGKVYATQGAGTGAVDSYPAFAPAMDFDATGGDACKVAS